MTAGAPAGGSPSGGGQPAGAALGAAGAAPRRQGLVLAALILVASVANLNLAVANVALPEIGKAFSASQTQLDLIAVGYSLGLAASVLYFGAIGDRYGRKLLLDPGHGHLHAGGPARRPRAGSERAVRGARARRPRRRHGLPDHPGAHHGAVVGHRPDQVHRALVRHRRRHVRPGLAARRRPPRALRLGLGVLRHHPAGRRGPRHGRAPRPRPRQRDHRARGQPRRHRLHLLRGGDGAGHQLRAGARHGLAGSRARGDRRAPPASSSSCGSDARRTRSTTSRSPGGARSGWPPWPASSSSAR